MPGDLGGLVNPDAVPTKLASGLGAVDGPVFSRLGYLLFSDTEMRQILKWEDGKVSVFRKSTPAISLTFDHQGRLLACEGERVTRTEKNGKVTVLADQLKGTRDLIYAIDGSIYFSAAGPGAPAIYQITRRGEVRAVSRDCGPSASVTLAPNQQRLYAGDTAAQKIYVFDIADDGALRGGRVFAQAAIRGLKTDEAGNLWAAEGHAIGVYDASGSRRGEIPLPEDPSNCAWGDGFRNLYITAQTSIYRIETRANGTRTY